MSALLGAVGCNALFGVDRLGYEPTASGTAGSSSMTGSATGAGGQCTPMPETCQLPATDADCDGLACGDAFWAQDLGEASQAQVVTDAIIDPSGNLIIAGLFTGTLEIGAAKLDSGPSTGLFFAKLGRDGTVAWASSTSGTPAGAPNGVRLVSDRQGGAFGLKLTDGKGFTVYRITTNGDVKTSELKDASSGCEASALALLPNGNVLLAGDFTAPLPFGGDMLVTNGGKDLFVLELGPNLEQLKATSYGGSNDDVPHGIAVASSGNIAVTGSTQGGGAFGMVLGPGKGNVFVMTLSASYATQKIAVYGDASNGAGYALAFDASDRIVLAGSSPGYTDFGLGTQPLPPGGFVALLEGIGSLTPKWAHGHGGVLWVDVDVAPNGDTLVCGGANGTIQLGGPDLPAGAGSDAVALRLDSAGKYQWSGRFGDGGDQFCYAVAAAVKNRMILTGGLGGTMKFPSQPKAITLTDTGKGDAWVASLNMPMGKP